MSESRLERLRKLMALHGIDAVVLVPSANLFYLTGLEMHLSERVTLAIFTSDAAHLILPALEAPQVEARALIPLTLHSWADAQWVQAGWTSLNEKLSLENRSVAIDYYSARVLELSQLQEFAPGMKMSDAAPLFTELRIAKDATEIAAMKRAAGVLEDSIETLVKEMKIGKTEREIAARWQWLMFEHGADSIPDAPIVASGPNGALPHTSFTDRKLENGDLVTLDGWCTVDGYFGDITRTFSIGSVSEEMRRVYEVCLRANEAGRAAGRPGALCQDIDRAARGVIREAGLGDFFLHRTGHGLGLEVHEQPNMLEGDMRVLVPGVTYTVEPGIYLAGKGGVRIEDDIVVTQDGSESLTVSTRELRVL